MTASAVGHGVRRATLDVSEIRSRFPALERLHRGKPVAFFDGPGGTQVPRCVVEAMTDYLYHHNANTHWCYPTSVETDASIAGARKAMADLFNASPDEISFGNNMTTIAFHVARSLGRAWGPGDEVIVTDLDHHANVAPWQAVARERGITIRSVPFSGETGRLDWQSLERTVGPRTRLLAIGAASNALGTVTDVSAAARIAHGVGALIFVDAVHFAAHGIVDVRAMDCDFLACSSYKFYGPHAGVLYGRRDLLAELDVPRLLPAPDEVPERLETGTQNHEGMVGTGAAVDFLASLGDGPDRRSRLTSAMTALHARGELLVSRMWAGLSAIPGVRCHGPLPGTPRTPTVSFTIDGMPSERIARRLADAGIFVSHGDFYATTVARQLGHGEDGLVRAGCACYTTEEEVDRLIREAGVLVGRAK